MRDKELMPIVRRSERIRKLQEAKTALKASAEVADKLRRKPSQSKKPGTRKTGKKIPILKDEEPKKKRRTAANIPVGLKTDPSPTTDVPTQNIGVRVVLKPGSIFKRDRLMGVHGAVKRVSDEASWYSDPLNYTELPYPSIRATRNLNFSKLRRDGITFFPFVGRELFADIFGYCKKYLDEGSYGRKLILHGPVGSGRASLLAALTCLLTRLGHHVVFIPGCSLLLLDFVHVMRDALYFAIPSDLQTAIDVVNNPEEIFELVEDFKKGYFVFIFPDWDILFFADGSRAEQRATILEHINRLTRNHYSVCGVWGSVECTQALRSYEDTIDILHITKGLSHSEVASWWAHNAETLPKGMSTDDKEEIQYYTGNMPLYLKGLLNFPGRQYQEIKREFLTNKVFGQFQRHIRLSIERKLEAFAEDEAKTAMLIDHIRACLQGTALNLATEPQEEFYDRRFSYFQDRVGHFVVGKAYDEATMLLQSRTSSFYDDEGWINAAKVTSNFFLRKLFLVQVCLSRIAHDGLKAIDERLVPIKHEVYDGNVPMWLFASCYLLIPSRIAAALIDGIACLFNNRGKTMELFFIQVGSSVEERANDEVFYLQRWKMLADNLSSNPITCDCAASFNYIFLYCGSQSPPLVEKKKLAADGWEVEYNLYSMSFVALDANLQRII